MANKITTGNSVEDNKISDGFFMPGVGVSTSQGKDKWLAIPRRAFYFK